MSAVVMMIARCHTHGRLKKMEQKHVQNYLTYVLRIHTLLTRNKYVTL